MYEGKKRQLKAEFKEDQMLEMKGLFLFGCQLNENEEGLFSGMHTY